MTTVRNKSIHRLRELAKERSTIKEIRPKPTDLGFERKKMTKAKPHNFMMSLINEIERLRSQIDAMS